MQEVYYTLLVTMDKVLELQVTLMVQTAAAAYVGRKARGTAASPSPVQSGDVLTRYHL